MVGNCAELGPALKQIILRMLANQNLCKLIYYTDDNPLNHADFDTKTSLYRKNIRYIPKLLPEENATNYVIPVITSGLSNKNSEYEDITVKIYVYVPMDQWTINNDNLRPFAIIGELQNTLCGKKINGIGKIAGGDFELNLLTDDMSCYTINFIITQNA